MFLTGDAVKENEERRWNELSVQLKNETSQILDTQLTKYELWLKTMMLFMEESVEKNENDIQSLIQTQKYLILKVLQLRQPPIETLKVGYFVENELKSKSTPNVMKATRQWDRKSKKRVHTPTVSTPILGQSFTPIIGLDQLRQSDSSDDDDGIGHISPPHGRSSSLRINIQQNIYNASYAERDLTKRGRKKKRRPKRLRLVNQLSDPIKTVNYQSDGDLDDDILCTIDPPNGGKMPKRTRMRRKRSNSFSAESPSKLKLFPDSYLE